MAFLKILCIFRAYGACRKFRNYIVAIYKMGLFWNEKRKEDNVPFLCVLGQQCWVNSTLDTKERGKLQLLSTTDSCDEHYVETENYRIIEALEGTLKIIQFH